ncbi:predicted protein, partial [Haematococcus lacustris]
LIHGQLFPIDYEDAFFHKASASKDRIFSYAAILPGLPGVCEQLVAFVIARFVTMRECDPVDRHHLGLWGPVHDSLPGIYILTLGVAPGWRQAGLACKLLALVQQHAVRV